jgi:FRG domain
VRSEMVIKSVEDFTAVASRLRDQWTNLVLPWFRGHQNAEWDLVPKFYRKPPRDLAREFEIREEFITSAPALCDIQPANEWEWYFLMQHYGAPTRLLDWTDGALIALYFAVRENRGDCSAAVWALNPWWLNGRVIRKDEVIPPGDPLILARDRKVVNRWLPNRFLRRARLPKLPMAVFPGALR